MASIDGESSVASNVDPRLEFIQSAGHGQLPIRVSFEHQKVGCEGEAAMSYMPPKRGTDLPPENFVLFILGNPALLDYYDDFLLELHNKVPDSYAILCTSHVGHDPSVPPPAKPFDIYQTLETKIELVAALQQSLNAWHAEGGVKFEHLPPPRFTLMGHSVGAWMCSQMLERNPEGIHVTYLLFPTLGWIGKTWNGIKMWPVFRAPLLQAGTGLAAIMRPFFRMADANPTTLKLIHDKPTIKNVLYLARSEMDNIRAPNLTWWREESNQPVGRGIYTVWSGGKLDHWVGNEANGIREALGPERSWRIEGVKHAFCLYPGTAPAVANIVHRLMAIDVSHPDRSPTGPHINHPNELSHHHVRAHDANQAQAQEPVDVVVAPAAAPADPVVEKQAQREQYYAAQQEQEANVVAEEREMEFEREVRLEEQYDAAHNPEAVVVTEREVLQEEYYAAQQQPDEYEEGTYEHVPNGEYQRDDDTYQPPGGYAKAPIDPPYTDKKAPYIQTNIVADKLQQEKAHQEKALQHEKIQQEELSRPAYNQTDSQPDINEVHVQRPYLVV